MASAVRAPVASVDVDEGLEAALEDIGKATFASSSLPDSALGEDALQFDVEPAAPAVRAVPAVPDPTAEPVSEPELVLAEAELAPLEAGESDEFDDIFVELIEE